MVDISRKSCLFFGIVLFGIFLKIERLYLHEYLADYKKFLRKPHLLDENCRLRIVSSRLELPQELYEVDGNRENRDLPNSGYESF